jgi:hypothetical protein
MPRSVLTVTASSAALSARQECSVTSTSYGLVVAPWPTSSRSGRSTAVHSGSRRRDLGPAALCADASAAAGVRCSWLCGQPETATRMRLQGTNAHDVPTVTVEKIFS